MSQQGTISRTGSADAEGACGSSSSRGPCDLTVIVLTFNEELHIARCLASLDGLPRRILVVDCYSSDRTREVAASMGAEVLTHEWSSHAGQFNWALDNAGIDTTWVMRLDADEVAMPGLVETLRRVLPCADESTAGFTLNLRRYFMNRWLRHGALYPIRLLRIWRVGKGRCENRWMDEHVEVGGRIEHLAADFADWTLHDITRWTAKHNEYATKEAIQLLSSQIDAQASRADGPSLGSQAKAKRWLKNRVYARLPLGMRAFAYFGYRYFLRLGFLDGWPGLVFHVLQGFWYRFLVDVKVYELRLEMQERRQSLAEVVRTKYGLEIAPVVSTSSGKVD